MSQLATSPIISPEGNAAQPKIGALALFPHHVEHLIPLCELLGAPLIAIGEQTARAAHSSYPFSNIETIDSTGSTWASIAFDPLLRRTLAQFDVIVYSHLLHRNELRAIFGGPGKTPPRIIFCPHGFSEKKQQWSATAAYQDISIFYGPLGLKQLTQWGVADLLGSHVIAGNLRYSYYVRHRAFFDQLMHQRGVSSASSSGRTVLYAPTWNDAIGSSSFHDVVEPLIRGLPNDWRLLIKPHPLLEDDISKDVRDLISDHCNVTLLRDCPLTYPVLERADIYVGDMSALAYDFLMYNRPIIFLNQNAGNDSDPYETQLLQCGVVLSPANYKHIHDFIGREVIYGPDYTNSRRHLYEQVYSAEEPQSTLRSKIMTLVRDPAPSWML